MNSHAPSFASIGSTKDMSESVNNQERSSDVLVGMLGLIQKERHAHKPSDSHNGTALSIASTHHSIEPSSVDLVGARAADVEWETPRLDVVPESTPAAAPHSIHSPLHHRHRLKTVDSSHAAKEKLPLSGTLALCQFELLVHDYNGVDSHAGRKSALRRH